MNRKTVLKSYAGLICRAEADHTSIAPFTGTDSRFTADEAYLAQDLVLEQHISRGELPVGYKIGLSSKQAMALYGIDEPDYGTLFDVTEIRNGVVDAAALFCPKAEGEIAFILSEDLFGTTYTCADILKRTAYAFPAVEIIDTRFAGGKALVPDMIADNASCGRFMLTEKLPYDGIDLHAVRMKTYRNGSLLSEGVGSNAFGDPAESVAWLANKLGSRGRTLKKGMVILSGSLTGSHPAAAGDEFRFEYDRFGSVTIRFV